ncbi:MAG TPA: PAS domain S-box protein [Pirellulaceae bacterium]
MSAEFSSPTASTMKSAAQSLLSEAEFRRLLERLPAGAYMCDRNGLITYFNDQAATLWGRKPTLGDPIDRFCGSFKLYLSDGSPIQHQDCWMAKALQTGQDFTGQEIVIERPDGTRRTALAHASPLRNEAGEIVGAVNVLVDITDRDRAEQTQRLLASIVESSDDAIVSKSLTGIIRSWNSGAQRLFGYLPEEVIGKPITIIIPPERQHEEEAILTKLRRGERVDHYDTIRVTKDGRRLDISLTISPIRDANGKVVAVSKVARDITSKKQAEQSLVLLKDELASQLTDLRRLHDMSTRLSKTLDLKMILEETLRTATAIENTDMGMISLVDSETGALKLATNLGIEPDFLSLVQRAPSGVGALGVCYAEKRRVIVEETETDPIFNDYRDAARLAGFRAVHSTPLITRAGRLVGVLSTHFRSPRKPTDRTMHLGDLCARQAVEFIENARLYSELQSSNRSKDEFLAVLAHELRNPLAPIRNSLHILRLSGELTPAGEKIQEVMERQVDHLVRMVDDLLEVSRISRGKIELRRQPLELATAILNAVETSRPLIDEAGHQLAISIPPQPLTLNADSVRLSQIIANVLNNAAKYTDPGGQIWLTAQPEEDEVLISIRDTGIGIPRDKLNHVFDMFAQIQPAGRRTTGGLGIGLTLVKRLTEMHGGRVEVASAGPGQGSEFTIRLPLEKSLPEPPPAAEPRLPDPRTALSERRILVVDDNRDAADSLGLFLKFMGAAVHVAYDGGSALESLPNFRPEIVLLDVGMPVLDGFEVARRMRQLPEGQNILLVAVTGWGQEDDRRRTADAGFDQHLVKPVDPVMLQNLLAAFDPEAAAEKRSVG